MHYLIVETGKHKGKRMRIPDGESVVGRDEQSQIRIASEEVSRQHCVLISQTERLIVRDLGSRNGTFINGRPITSEVILQPGDHLVIGPMGFLFQPADAEPPAAASDPRQGKKVAKPESQKLSDDDIASWLAVGAGDASSNSDTAVIETTHPPAKRPEVVVPPKRVFRSTAEEGADIIRRHKESLRGS
ncbi:MAG: FHA domain-containing protein [Planctomycetaceae bacterium]